ncbi:MAG: hypothetical protein EPO31_00725 [Gammaproteobacteria bacterium]|nr:MAG: hypothetical protein EPO31_00725 [Gammaproteobacteria bacterium]
MPGAFAHMIAANKAKFALEKQGLQFPIKALNLFPEWLQSGAVGPDYPYLHHALTSHDPSDNWADRMHYERTGDVVRVGIRHLRERYSAEQTDDLYLRVFAWFFGYASHVMLDATIHPVVRAIVGEYAEHKTEHRTCEMYMDSYIYRETYGTDLVNSEWADYLRHLNYPEGKFDEAVVTLWDAILREVYPQEYARNPPQISAWHDAYVNKLDKADVNALFFRHAAAGKGVLYIASEDIPIDTFGKYIENAALPPNNRFNAATMHYSKVFELGVDNIARVWTVMAAAIEGNGDLEIPLIANWNLDTGTIDLEGKGDATLWV